MICQYCNEEINDNALFCPVCGQKSNISTQVAPKTSPQVATQTPPTQGTGLQFGQGQRLTPPGQTPPSPPKSPQVATQTSPSPAKSPQVTTQSPTTQGTGMQFGQGQRLTPPGQTPPSSPKSPQVATQTPTTQGTGMQFGQGQRLTPPGQTPPSSPKSPQVATQTPLSQGTGLQFGQGQRLTPSGQTPPTPPKSPQVATQTPPTQGSGMQFGQGQRLTPPGQSGQKTPEPNIVQTPPPVSHLSEKQRLTPPPQEEIDSESSKKWPIFLGLGLVLCVVSGVVWMKMNATVPGLTQGSLPEISTGATIDALSAMKEYTHFANRSDITNEAVMSYFSQGTWEEIQDNFVHYEGVLHGSQESIKLGYSVDSTTGQGTLTEFSINNVSLGRDYDSTNAFFTQLFQLACTGLDVGEVTIPYFNLDELLFSFVRYAEILEGSYLYYCDLDDVLYPDNTWEVTPVTDSSFYVDFKGYDQDTLIIFSRLLVETLDASVKNVYFTENKVEYDQEGLTKWAETASERFLNMMENSGQITTAPQTAPEVVTISDSAILDVYIKELQRYSEGFRENWSANQFQQVGLPETTSLFTVDSLFVTFVDFDNNGIPEMIVKGDEESVLGIHTLSKNSNGYEVKLLIADSIDNKISLGNGGFIAETLVTAFESITTLYQVSGTELKSLDATDVTWAEDIYESMPIMALLPAEMEALDEEDGESEAETGTEPEPESETEADVEQEAETVPEIMPQEEIVADTVPSSESTTETEPSAETEIEINTT